VIIHIHHHVRADEFSLAVVAEDSFRVPNRHIAQSKR